MLTSAGVAFQPIAPNVDEEALKVLHSEESAEGLAKILSLQKAMAVSKSNPGRYVLGSDQTLEHNGQIISKSSSRSEAADQLRRFSNTQHLLWSAAVLVLDEQIVLSSVSSARVKIRPLTPGTIERYLDVSGSKIFGSVGVYQMEAEGIHLIESIEGDYWTILGLPLLQLTDQLRRRGLLAG